MLSPTNAVAASSGSEVDLEQLGSIWKIRSGHVGVVTEDLGSDDYRQVESAQALARRADRWRKGSLELRVGNREREAFSIW